MNTKQISHLYHRACFGIGKYGLKKLKRKSKKATVNSLFEDSITFTPLKVNTEEIDVITSMTRRELRKKFDYEKLAEFRKKSQQKVKELNIAWINRLQEDASFREKMTLFWANVFVCRDNNNIFFIQRYNNTLRQHALGNLGEFVKAIAKEASMSRYLNNDQNKKKSPNENFARELMELFTLGVGNYTEKDIKEAARAFTGWSYLPNGDFKLIKFLHDNGEKTFLGQTGNFNGDDIIDIILQQKQCARFICSKIYTYFVNPKINYNHLEEITEVFYKDYSIENVMRYLFNSDWFYDDENIGVKIKSPMELIVGMHQIVPIKFTKTKQLRYFQKMTGQMLLFPDNVSGWKGNTSWIDSNTLMFRMRLASIMLNNAIIKIDEKQGSENKNESFYTKVREKSKVIKTVANWEKFQQEYKNVTPQELKEIIIQPKIDKDTATYLAKLKITSNREFCIQLMSTPEYQLC